MEVFITKGVSECRGIIDKSNGVRAAGRPGGVGEERVALWKMNNAWVALLRTYTHCT